MMTPNRKPYKIRWSRLFLCMSLVAMVVGGVFSNASYFWHLSLWTHRIGLRDELWMKDGSLVTKEKSYCRIHAANQEKCDKRNFDPSERHPGMLPGKWWNILTGRVFESKKAITLINAKTNRLSLPGILTETSLTRKKPYRIA